MITVSIIKENKDGSADANIRFDKSGMEILVQWGMIAILKEVKDAYAIPIEDKPKKKVVKKPRKPNATKSAR